MCGVLLVINLLAGGERDLVFSPEDTSLPHPGPTQGKVYVRALRSSFCLVSPGRAAPDAGWGGRGKESPAAPHKGPIVGSPGRVGARSHSVLRNVRLAAVITTCQPAEGSAHGTSGSQRRRTRGCGGGRSSRRPRDKGSRLPGGGGAREGGARLLSVTRGSVPDPKLLERGWGPSVEVS